MNYTNFLISSDMDGTLIDSKQQISRENLCAIADFKAGGGTFVVATGRTPENLLPHIKELPLTDPAILYNGAAVYDFSNHAFLHTEFLNSKILVSFLHHCLSSYPNMVVEIFSPSGLMIVSPPENRDPFVEAEKQQYRQTTLEEAIKEPWFKILLNDTHEVLLSAQENLHCLGYANEAGAVFSQKYYLELLAKGVSKGRALRWLMQFSAYKNKTSVAVGDYDNDIEMIKAANIGIAMGNGTAAVKQAANLITVTNDEHALREIIYKILPLKN